MSFPCQTFEHYFDFIMYGCNLGRRFIQMNRAYIFKFINYLQPPLLNIKIGSYTISDKSIRKYREVLKWIKISKSLFIYVN
jgi:hypothetical protein